VEEMTEEKGRLLRSNPLDEPGGGALAAVLPLEIQQLVRPTSSKKRRCSTLDSPFHLRVIRAHLHMSWSLIGST